MKIFLIIFLSFFFSNLALPREVVIIKKDGSKIQYDHDEMRTYLSNDELALDTEISYAKAIRLQMVGYWEEVAKLYKKIANRGHPIAQLHLGKQYVHGNGVELDLAIAYKWFFLSETPIGKHFIEEISKDMTEAELKKAKRLVKEFKPVYK